MCTKNLFPRGHAPQSIGSLDLAAHMQVEITFSANLTTYVTKFLFTLKLSANIFIQKNFWELRSQVPILFPPSPPRYLQARDTDMNIIL